MRIEAATTCGTDVKSWQRGHPLLTAVSGRIRPRDGRRARGHRRARAGRRLGRVRHLPPLPGGPAADLQRPALAVRRVRRADGGARGRPARDPGRARAGGRRDGRAARGGRARDRPRARPRDRAGRGVLGGGPMGQMLAALLVAEGRTVTLADRHPERRAQAEAPGASAASGWPTTTSSSRPWAAPRRGARRSQACAPGRLRRVGRRLPGRHRRRAPHRARCTTTSSTSAAPSTTRRTEVDRALALLADGASTGAPWPPARSASPAWAHALGRRERRPGAEMGRDPRPRLNSAQDRFPVNRSSV